MKHPRARVDCMWVLCAYGWNNQLYPRAEALLNNKELFSGVANPTCFKGNKFCYGFENEAPQDSILTP